MRAALTFHTLHLRQAFTISRGSRTEQRTTVVALADGEGCTGYGEVADNFYYTQAHPDEVAKVLGSLAPVLAKADPDAPAELFAACEPLVGGNYFALSALDMAAHDLAARRARRPLYGYWGYDWDEARIPVSNYTLSIGAPEAVLAQALANPWPSYKVKLGGGADVETVALLRAELPEVQLCVDANAAWEEAEATEKSIALASHGVAFVEQPCARGAFAKTRRARARVHAEQRALKPLFVADEDCQTEGDVAKCERAFDVVNVKLSKCGGPTPARRMVAEAKALGLGVMFGCMIESSYAIGVLRHFAAVADFIDLDGHLLIGNDIARGIDFLPDGRPARPTGYGSGVEPV